MIALRQFAQTSFKDETDRSKPVDPEFAHGICAGLCREWLHLRTAGDNNSMPNYYLALSSQRAYSHTMDIKRAHHGFQDRTYRELKEQFWGGAGLTVRAYWAQQGEISTRIRSLGRGSGIAICIQFHNPLRGRGAHALAVARLPGGGRLRFFDPNGGDKVAGGGEWGFPEATLMLSNAHEVRTYINTYYQVLRSAAVFKVSR